MFVADGLVRTPGLLVPRDFLEYWSAGRVNLRGGNPYHPSELFAEQKRADPTRADAVMMWNPPSALALYMPLGACAPRWAMLLWIGLQLAAVFVACDLLWRAYCPVHRWFAALVALSFVGTWWLVSYGQNTGLLLLGLAGFVHFTKNERPLAAGACAALTALKPHLLAVFGVLLVTDVLTRRGRATLGAGCAVLVLALGIALVANPRVVSQFIAAVRTPEEGAVPLSEWALPVPAYWLRMWLAPGHFWVQFVPCVVACAGFLGYRVYKGNTWAWTHALPLICAVSVLATPYGGWLFDLPILLLPVLWVTARFVRNGNVASRSCDRVVAGRDYRHYIRGSRRIARILVGRASRAGNVPLGACKVLGKSEGRRGYEQLGQLVLGRFWAVKKTQRTL